MVNPPYPIRIALTTGEPAGIGPDLCIALSQSELPCELVAIGSPDLLMERAKCLGLPIKLNAFNAEIFIPQQPGQLTFLPVDLLAPVVPGQLNAANSRYVLKAITKAVNGCLKNQFAAMVTAPVHKSIINDAGIAFIGHTEFIADITGGYPVMMLVTPGLRVALVTIHVPLVEVSKAITHNRLRQVLRVLDRDLRERFGINKPRIAVCGLNPHAGENGYLGREEIDIIEPVLNGLRKQGMILDGPLPADTIFTPKHLDKADAVLAMYHDQGLPVLKYKGFGNAVNITLGLPIIRTSVDHGTALDLAGSGLADPGSLKYALETALTLVEHHHG
jgi:4-hydroxythreonine-4-phosphate dehydrogenase